MKTFTTLSGNIINLDQIAMITVVGRNEDQPIEEATLTLHFSATFNGAKGGRSMRLILKKEEARDFLGSLEKQGTDVKNTLKALDERVI
jgi:hypothetical protein